MNAAAAPVPGVSDAGLELVVLNSLGKKIEGELPVVVSPSHSKTDALPFSEDGKKTPAAADAVASRGRSWWHFWLSPARFFALLHREFSSSLLVLLISNYLFIKGASNNMAVAVSTPVFRELLHLPAEKHSLGTAIFMIPWSMKGIIGSFSDLWALGGYHKRSYMVASAIVGVLGATVLVACSGFLTYGVAVTAFFMIMVQASFNDLLCEGTYTRRMAAKKHTGAALTSFVWLCSSLGTFLQAIWIGPVVDHLPFQVVLAPFLPLALQQLVLMLYPWPFKSWAKHSGVIEEKFVPEKRFKAALLKEHARLFVCAGFLTAFALGSMIAGLLNDERHIVGLLYWFFSGVSMIVIAWYTMPSYMAKPVLYMFLGRLAVPTISSQFSYWLRAGADCAPSGPHFNWTFLLTWNALAQSVFAAIGVALFQRYVSKWTFRNAFLITSVLQQFTCIFDVAMVMGWNRTLGIPDRVWYFCSASIIEEVATMWSFMPSCVLISRLCPNHMESTMYAVIAGMQNFASSISKLSGNFLCYTVLGIRTMPDVGAGCNFDYLPLAIGIAMGICPLLPISLTFWLVPNLHMNEKLLPEDGDQKDAEEKTAEEPAALEGAEPAAAAAATAPAEAAGAAAAELHDPEENGSKKEKPAAAGITTFLVPSPSIETGIAAATPTDSRASSMELQQQQLQRQLQQQRLETQQQLHQPQGEPPQQQQPEEGEQQQQLQEEQLQQQQHPEADQQQQHSQVEQRQQQQHLQVTVQQEQQQQQVEEKQP